MKLTIENSSDDTQIGVIDSTGRDIVDRLVDRVADLERTQKAIKSTLTKLKVDFNLIA